MRPEQSGKLGFQHLVRYSHQRLESFFDQPTRNISHAAKELANGQLVTWKFYTLGLIVDGTNQAALPLLFTAKGIDYQKALDGKRPVVSVLPPREYRDEIIAFDRHPPEIQAILRGEERQLLTAEGNPIFYRVFAQDAPYLQPPLVGINDEQAETLVILWHDNKHVLHLEQQAREHKFAHTRRDEGRAFLLTGSSANPTGEKQPVLLSRLDPSVRLHARSSVDVQDRRIHSFDATVRGSIPMIDLTHYPPTVMREGMYPAIPVHRRLQELLGMRPDPGATRKAS